MCIAVQPLNNGPRDSGNFKLYGGVRYSDIKTHN